MDFNVITGDQVVGLFTGHFRHFPGNFGKMLIKDIGDLSAVVTDNVVVGVAKVVIVSTAIPVL